MYFMCIYSLIIFVAILIVYLREVHGIECSEKEEVNRVKLSVEAVILYALSRVKLCSKCKYIAYDTCREEDGEKVDVYSVINRDICELDINQNLDLSTVESKFLEGGYNLKHIITQLPDYLTFIDDFSLYTLVPRENENIETFVEDMIESKGKKAFYKGIILTDSCIYLCKDSTVQLVAEASKGINEWIWYSYITSEAKTRVLQCIYSIDKVAMCGAKSMFDNLQVTKQ